MSKFTVTWIASTILLGSCAVGTASPIHVEDIGAGISFDTDSGDIGLSYGPNGTSIGFEYNIPGPDSPFETQPGTYLYNTEYSIYLTSSQVITNPTNFSLDPQFIVEDDSNVLISSYVISSTGDYIDTSQDFPINGGGLVVTPIGIASAPLPASAWMFGTALVALGAVGYGLKGKAAAAA